jgi:hypothetical protein
MRLATQTVLMRLVGPIPPKRGDLSWQRERQILDELLDAHIRGEIPGFPFDGELMAAELWVTGAAEWEWDFRRELGREVGPRPTRPRLPCEDVPERRGEPLP